jgi:hypothetical protein
MVYLKKVDKILVLKWKLYWTGISNAVVMWWHGGDAMQHNVRTRAASSLGFKLILNVKEEGTTFFMVSWINK